MPLAIYMDVHIPVAITTGVRRLGIDALTSQEDGTTRLDDESLLNRATATERVLFTQDDDLLRVAAQWQQQNRQFMGVIFAHQLSAGIGTLVHDLVLLLSCCSPDELANQVKYLPLR